MSSVLFWGVVVVVLVLLAGDYALWTYAVHDGGSALTWLTSVVFWLLLIAVLVMAIVRSARWVRKRRAAEPR